MTTAALTLSDIALIAGVVYIGLIAAVIVLAFWWSDW